MQKKCFRILVAALLISALLVVPAFAEGAVVTGSGVNLRSGPGLNYQVVDCLPKGASVTVTDRSNGEWYAVSYNGTSGFMSSHYLSISEGTASGGESAGEGTSGLHQRHVCALPQRPIFFLRHSGRIQYRQGADHHRKLRGLDRLHYKRPGRLCFQPVCNCV